MTTNKKKNRIPSRSKKDKNFKHKEVCGWLLAMSSRCIRAAEKALDSESVGTFKAIDFAEKVLRVAQQVQAVEANEFQLQKIRSIESGLTQAYFWDAWGPHDQRSKAKTKKQKNVEA